MSATLEAELHKIARDGDAASIIVNGYRDRLVKQVRKSMEIIRAAKGKEVMDYSHIVFCEVGKIGTAFTDLEDAEDGLGRQDSDPRLDRIRRLEAEIGVVDGCEGGAS